MEGSATLPRTMTLGSSVHVACPHPVLRCSGRMLMAGSPARGSTSSRCPGCRPSRLASALLGHARIDTTQISIRPPQLKRAVAFYEEKAVRMLRG